MKFQFYILTFLILALGENSFSQNPHWDWAKSAGGINNDAASSIAADSSGNTYVTGTFTSPTITFGSTVLTLTGSSDVFIVKYDSSGNPLWANSFGNFSDNVGNSIVTDKAGNIYVAGYFKSHSMSVGGFTLTNDTTDTTADIFIAKYHPNGNVIWAKRFGGSDQDYVSALTTDTACNVYLTGGFYSPSIVFGGTTLTSFGQPALYVTKMDSAGNVHWAKSARQSADGSTIASSTGGYLYVTGYLYDSLLIIGNDTLFNFDSHAYTPDVFIAKYDGNGNALWAKHAGGTDDDESTGSATDASGNLYIIGNFWSTIMSFDTLILTNQNTGGSDYFLAKYDGNGNALWAKGVTGQYCWGASVVADANGNVCVTGDFADTSMMFPPVVLNGSASGSNIFVADYNQNGNAQWAIGGKGFDASDTPTGIAEDAAKNIYIAGYFGDSTLIFGNDTLANDTNNYSGDVFVCKLSAPILTSSEVAIQSLQSITIYPNPTTGLFTISLPKNIMQGEVIVMNMMGQQVYNDTFAGNRKSMRLELSAGIYFVQVRSGSDIWTQKLVKE